MGTSSVNHLPPVFHQMDRVGWRLYDAAEGLRLSQLKYFRTSVPQSFQGSDLIVWLKQHLTNGDEEEAQHFGNLLLQHGYVFPVIENVQSLCNDATLYRLQIPYYWVSKSGCPENEEYAIYLCKRLRRNEEKHGLDEHEAESYNKLYKLLVHKWDFITIQADTQLKLFKEKKKTEKVVLDSQERAFWRFHRPPSNATPSVLQMRYGKAEKKIKKKTPRDYEQEIDRLKLSLKTKPWLKTPKATEMLVNTCLLYGEYDAFLANCIPSNPWISDDITFWTLNSDNVEIPTERRVKRWSLSAVELVRDPMGRQVLEAFLETEVSSENIMFWAAVQDLKYSPKSEVAEKMIMIFEEFLAEGAVRWVNVDAKTRDASNIEALEHNDNSVRPQRYVFSAAEEQIFTLMSRDSYPRFVRSDIYKKVLNAAQQQGSKKVGLKGFLENILGSKKQSTVGWGSLKGSETLNKQLSTESKTKNAVEPCLPSNA